MPGTKGVSLFETSHRDHVWLHFKRMRGPQAPSIHYKGIAASHLSQSKAEHQGGMQLMLGCLSHHFHWDKSLEAEQTLLKDVTRGHIHAHLPVSQPRKEQKNVHSQKNKCIQACKDLLLRPEEKTNSEHTHTLTGDWALIKSMLYANRPGGNEKPWGGGGRLWSKQRVSNERVGNIHNLCLFYIRLFCCSFVIFIHICEDEGVKGRNKNIQHDILRCI